MAYSSKIESYPEEFLTILCRGAEREVRIPLPLNKAHSLRVRLNSFRKLLGEKEHFLYQETMSCLIRIEDARVSNAKDRPVVLVLQPRSEEPLVKDMMKALGEQGIQLPSVADIAQRQAQPREEPKSSEELPSVSSLFKWKDSDKE